MKQKVFILFIAVVLIMYTSCTKSFLDQNLKSTYAPENTMVDSLGFVAAVTGLMKTVRDQYAGPDQGGLALMQVGTDVCRNSATTPAASQIAFENYTLLNSQDLAASYFWKWGYGVINASNLIIESAEDPHVKLSASGKAVFAAEAKFYRAYAYNFLNTLYGDIPLLAEPLTSPKTDFTRTPTDSILPFIISDLKFATINLPDPDYWIGLNKEGMINKYAASQLLAEVYLRNNQPALAEQECQNIINSGAFQLIKNRYGVNKNKPGDPFSDMFDEGNIRRSQGNTEAIWVIELDFGVPGGGVGGPGDEHRRVWGPYYASINGMLVADSLGGRGIGRLVPTTWWIYDLYAKNDMRNSPYNIRREFRYNNPAFADFGKLVVASGTDTLGKINASTTKWDEYRPEDPFGGACYKDITQMRLGETYLLLAEAQFKQSKPEEAAASINVLRDRAHTESVLSSDITMDFILDERARELIGEENRRKTLVRTGTLLERVNKFNPTSATSIKEFNALLPIPQSEINLNKDAVLKQNEGY